MPADRRAQRYDLLCIAGRGGAGKTTVATEISSQLKRAGVAHCRIDGDWLDLAHPQAPPSLFDENFRSLWGNYRAHGCTRLIYSNFAAIRNIERLKALMGVSPRVTGVLLLADDAAAVERLHSREHGQDLQWHIDNLAATPAAERDMDAITPPSATRVQTTGRTVADIAAEIIAVTGWA